MGLFSKRSSSTSDAGLQFPDKLAQQADLEYGTQQFAAAFETYAEAVDKIHTMCVATPQDMRRRTPGPGDQAILSGIQNALGAALAMDSSLDPSSTVERTVAYLWQIADQAGAERQRYIDTANELEGILRRR